jgi:hypothetical protein
MPSVLRFRLAGLAWLAAPVAAWLAFGPLGFSPTDDGWLPAVARRIAEGEVPHRDFIFVRPALSALFQVPLVWWGGEYTILLARLGGWVALAAVGWLWVTQVAAAAPLATRLALAAAALAVGAHTFPVMAWHSLDGLLLCSLAVAAAGRGTAGGRRMAFLLVGTAALCRQNFGLFAPFLLLAVGGPPRTWFAAAGWTLLPPAAYFAVIAVLGGGSDLLAQLTSTGSGHLYVVGVHRFLIEPWFLLAIGGGFLFGRVQHYILASWSRWLAFLAAAGALALAVAWGPGWFGRAAFALHGAAIGLAFAWRQSLSPDDRRLVIAAAGLAWVAAISLGYNSPGLAAGVLLPVLWRLLQFARFPLVPPPPPRELAFAAAALTLAGLAAGRWQFPYLDRPARELTHAAGAVLPGAAGLRTNPVTHATLADLQALTARLTAERRPYVILTDFSAHWIRSPQRNPLPCEWPQETELGFNRDLFRRVFLALRDLPPDARIVVQKFLCADGGWQRTPVPDSPYYFVQTWVRQHCTPAGESDHFTIYPPPPRDAIKGP